MEINRITEKEAIEIKKLVGEFEAKRNEGYDGTCERCEPIEIREYKMSDKNQWDRIEQKLNALLEALSKQGLQKELGKLGVKDIKL